MTTLIEWIDDNGDRCRIIDDGGFTGKHKFMIQIHVPGGEDTNPWNTVGPVGIVSGKVSL